MKLASFQKIIFYLSVFLLERKKKLKKTKIQSHFLAHIAVTRHVTP